MSVRPVRQTESDAVIQKLFALEDSVARRRLVKENPGIDWDDVVKTLTERVWQEVRVDTHRADHTANVAIEGPRGDRCHVQIRPRPTK